MELRECPFCGGDARIIAKPYETKVCVGCDDDTCLGFYGLGWLYDTEREAAEAWNRRAERTCKRRNHDTDDYYMRYCSCSRCNSAWFEDIYDNPFSYCPHCGAKVVDE